LKTLRTGSESLVEPRNVLVEASPTRVGQTTFLSVLLHFFLLVRFYTKVGERFCTAYQDKSGFLILGIIANSFGLVDFSLEEP
jgi:hypothetical protein